jgi:hypothetical protein
MFLLKILAFLDLLVAVMLITLPFEVFSFRLILGGTLYLILKAYLFKGDALSIIDGIIGLYLFIGFFFPSNFLSYLLGGWIFIKAFYSLVSSL